MNEVDGAGTGMSPSERSGTGTGIHICRTGLPARRSGAYSTGFGLYWAGGIRTARDSDPRGVHSHPGQQHPDLVQYAPSTSYQGECAPPSATRSSDPGARATDPTGVSDVMTSEALRGHETTHVTGV